MPKDTVSRVRAAVDTMSASDKARLLEMLQPDSAVAEVESPDLYVEDIVSAPLAARLLPVRVAGPALVIVLEPGAPVPVRFDQYTEGQEHDVLVAHFQGHPVMLAVLELLEDQDGWDEMEAYEKRLRRAPISNLPEGFDG